MAETLTAIVLITTSAKGSNLVFRWPPNPTSSPRLSRPKPDTNTFISQIDNPWRASGFNSNLDDDEWAKRDYGRDTEYAWERPYLECVNYKDERGLRIREYDYLFGYSAEFLAAILCPQDSQCHQKFELIVDDLAFIGHPVAADQKGQWSFKSEIPVPNARGRDYADSNGTLGADLGQKDRDPKSRSASVDKTTQPNAGKKGPWLQRFQLAFTLDMPDPSSSSSGNLFKYADIIYEQIVFPFTAVLYQEQVLSNFVEQECDQLISMKESYSEQARPYQDFVNSALASSSIASAMKSVYEAIKTKSIAYVTLNAIPIEFQLPPHLDDLLHNDADLDPDTIERFEDDELLNWGQELSFGWQLPPLVPWKSLIRLDGDNDLEDPIANLRGGPQAQISLDDRALAEKLIQFLDNAQMTNSLAEMATQLEWNLESQIYPVVRWLVQHRRVKVVDVVNPGLKTIFAIPAKLPQPLSKLCEEFNARFQHPTYTSLPQILASISSSLAQQSNNHFFASVVKHKDDIRLYEEVVNWMLKRDLLITLHLHIRVVATPDVKHRVWARRQQRRAKKFRSVQAKNAKKRMGQGRNVLMAGLPRSHGHLDLRNGSSGRFGEDGDSTGTTSANPNAGSRGGSIGWLSLGSTAQPKSGRRLSSADSRHSTISELVIQEDDESFEDDDGSNHSTSGGTFIGGRSRHRNLHDQDEFDDSHYEDEQYDHFGDGGQYEGEEDGDDEDEEEHDEEDDGSDETELTASGGLGGTDIAGLFAPSMIDDPGRATPLQRRWLAAMSEGKEPVIAKRFELINQYFDGKRSDDEILYRAEITRRELREVLHAYEANLQTFLHPS